MEYKLSDEAILEAVSTGERNPVLVMLIWMIFPVLRSYGTIDERASLILAPYRIYYFIKIRS